MFDYDMASHPYIERLEKVRGTLRRRRVDGILITDITNIRYLTGFTGSSGYLVITGAEALFFTDSRYTVQARSEVSLGKGCYRLKGLKGGLPAICRSIKGTGIKSLGFDGLKVSYRSYLIIKKTLGRGIRLRDLPGVVEAWRSSKSESELEVMREAIAIHSKGFEAAPGFFKVGESEIGAAAKIERLVRRSGADGLSFDMIVASGVRSALPHGAPSSKRIGKGEFVILDMGVTLSGYSSDQTRTFFTGRPSKRHRDLYGTVLKAHDKAIEKIRDGVKASIVDRSARSVINKAGYGKYFGHGTGHGVGLQIHESPGLSPKSSDTLREGMVITVEPGIYIPEFGGVRIEDMILVTKNGFELLTTPPPNKIMSI